MSRGVRLADDAARVLTPTHTLRIVVAGTAGPARVDLDALEIVR